MSKTKIPFAAALVKHTNNNNSIWRNSTFLTMAILLINCYFSIAAELFIYYKYLLNLIKWR